MVPAKQVRTLETQLDIGWVYANDIEPAGYKTRHTKVGQNFLIYIVQGTFPDHLKNNVFASCFGFACQVSLIECITQ